MKGDEERKRIDLGHDIPGFTLRRRCRGRMGFIAVSQRTSTFDMISQLSIWYPTFDIISNFRCDTQLSIWYPNFDMLSNFRYDIQISIWYPTVDILSNFRYDAQLSVGGATHLAGRCPQDSPYPHRVTSPHHRQKNPGKFISFGISMSRNIDTSIRTSQKSTRYPIVS